MASTSVVVPTKNTVATIDECLSSLMPYYEQGYVGEIVVVDGHSTDGTLEALGNYPVKVLFEDSGAGKGNIGMAYEIGWRNTNGELILLFDSDVYLEDGFFPEVFELLSDDVGWISSQQKAVVGNRITKAQAEDWLRGTPALGSSLSRSRRLYNKILQGRGQQQFCGGPCMLVRRSCLEAVNGFQGLSSATLGVGTGGCCGDICVSQRIARQGWKTVWWRGAPVCHHPRATLKGLMKQYHGYGKSLAHMHLEKEFRTAYPWHGKLISIIGRLASPALGISMAIRFRNPLQLVVYPLPRYAWTWGYIQGWMNAKRSGRQ